MKDDATLYIGQKAVIEKDGKILILMDPILGADLPGGKVQVGETDFALSLKREVREETSIEVEVGDPFYVWYYEFQENSDHRNKGKKIFCIAFACTYISGEMTLSDEHQGFEWVDRD